MNNRMRIGLVAAALVLIVAAIRTGDWTWLKARLGGTNSQLLLAHGYATGSGGVKQDQAEAFRWYLRAAEGGDSRGQQEVARRYDEGDGVAPDTDAATRWYQASADQVNPIAMLALARRHREGRGLPQDNVRAAMWLILADQYALQQPEGVALRDALKAELDPDQLAEARRLAADWRTTHGIHLARIGPDGKAAPEPAAPPVPEAAAGAGAAAAPDPAAAAPPVGPPAERAHGKKGGRRAARQVQP